ncbi:MAG: A/G-specific adenine glycosylase [Steroidobacteraceae bacterium]
MNCTPPAPAPIAAALIAWHARHGRHDLPWQCERTPYRVWVSEIMLQQTQVATVIGYYERFMQRFPDVAKLAAAPLDEVLHLWSGLGYYSRARNLHRTAQRVVGEHDGELPGEVDALAQLPGIGRSTAAAIVALAFDRRASILDGNVKRVLARYFAIDGPPGESATERELWYRAEQCTPQSSVAAYTQAIMDFGATLCTRRDPLCMHCPLREDCAAQRSGRVHELPSPRVRRTRRTRQVVMLLVMDPEGQVLLQRRPPQGVWGGLWTPPEFEHEAAAAQFCATALQAAWLDPEPLPRLRHAFTHFELEITPLRARCQSALKVMEGGGALWYNAREPARIGLPAPIAALLSAVSCSGEG